MLFVTYPPSTDDVKGRWDELSIVKCITIMGYVRADAF